MKVMTDKKREKDQVSSVMKVMMDKKREKDQVSVRHEGDDGQKREKDQVSVHHVGIMDKQPKAAPYKREPLHINYCSLFLKIE
ncbi:hypothetical protein M3172_08350 [Mesobacillus subterraneus]|uniref:hypothetical protein n=1 Tax=Mesobacillus subterraneus TaxID=285983 RepID=UPI00203EF6DF|nr:hypothetical protein [Mesobacillus subterraneus]MCM3573202.1 hypothetical protein [Mesobacillus subterraneus]